MEEKLNKVNKKTTNREDSTETQVWLTEFNAIRDEIIFRMRNADYFAVINLGIIGTILSLALTIEMRILLVIPFISSLLGLMYFNQLRHVQMLGHYIRKIIAPALRDECRNVSVLGWADYRKSRKKEWSVIPKLGLINAFTFVVPSLAVVVLTFPSNIIEQNLLWLKLIWGVGFILSVALVWIWLREEQYISTLEKDV